LAPQVAIAADGSASAVWVVQPETARDSVWANRSRPNGIWGTPAPIDDDTGDARDPQVAMDAAGNTIAVWRQDDGARFNIWSNRAPASSDWGGAERLEADADGAGVPQVAMNPSGHALAVWPQSRNISSNRYTPSAGWGRPQRVQTDVVSSTNGSSQVQIAMDPSGRATAVWGQVDDDPRLSIWASRYE